MEPYKAEQSSARLSHSLSFTMICIAKHFNLVMLRSFGLFCAAYFTANFLLRWGHFSVFSGHGAYGWPKPAAVQLVGISLAVLASALLVFVILPIAAARLCLLLRVPGRIVRTILAVTMISLILYAEVDNVWYAVSKEHLRWSDIQLFLVSNPVDHIGVSISQIGMIVVTLATHLVLLLLGLLAMLRLRQKFGNQASRLLWFNRGLLGLTALLLAVGFSAGYGLTMSKSEQWAAVASRNVYDFTARWFVKFRHADADRIDALWPRSHSDSTARMLGDVARIERLPSLAKVDHVLIIAIEGWNTKYFDHDTMPFLSSLRSQMLHFSRHYSSGNNTLLGMTGIAFGQTPALFFEQQANGVKASAALTLRESGFALARFGHGLNSYRNIEGYLVDWTEGPDTQVALPAESFQRIREHIAHNRQSVSIYYYGNTHFPYEHSPEFSKFVPEIELSSKMMAGTTEDEVRLIVNRYRNSLHEADTQMRRLLESLDWRRMAVFITGDHGEAMMENGRLSHSSSLEQPQIGTPMLLYYPGVVPGHFEQTSSHLDIMPTVLDLVGIHPPPGLHGTSVLRQHANRRALAVHNNQNSRPTKIAVVANDHKLIVDLEDLRTPKALDLLDIRDRPARIDASNEDSVTVSVAFLAEVLAKAGCALTGTEIATALATPMRHCLPGR